MRRGRRGRRILDPTCSAPNREARFLARTIRLRAFLRRVIRGAPDGPHGRGAHGPHGRANRLGAGADRAACEFGARVSLCGRAGRAMLARMAYVRARASVKGRCIECGGATGRRANVLRCVPCTRAVKARRKRAMRAGEIAKRAPRPCAKCGRIIAGRAAQARRCIECVRIRVRGPRPDRHCVDCGVNMGKRRSDAKRCRPCARVLHTARNRAWRAKVARAEGRG